MLKINLNSLVKPKVFWPVILILLILCATFYLQKEKEKLLRIVKETELMRTVEAKRVVENKLTEAEKQIAARDEQIKLALDKLEREVTGRKEIEAQLVTLTKEKQDLEAKFETIAAKLPQNIELEKIVIKTTQGISGKVLSFDKEHTFLIIDLGSEHNLKLGDVLSIYRDDKFIGKAQVEKIEGKTSAAVVLSPWRNVEYKESDMVKKL